jgi:hypothetical protein
VANTWGFAGDAMSAAVGYTLLALVALAGYVLWRTTPLTEAVRWRNALLLRQGIPQDFDWKPPAYPVDFVRDERPAVPEFLEVVSRLGIAAIPDDWGKALALAGHLTEHAEDRGPVQADLVTTYQQIRAGFGYCADFVRVYLALAHAAGLTVRQWAFSFDGFGGHGHTLVEVFDRQRDSWLLLDVFNNFHVVDTATGEPMGVLAFRDALLARPTSATMRRSGPGRPGFVHQHKAIDYFLGGIDQWYLMWSNAVFSYYAHPAVRVAGRISRQLAHVMANLVGVQSRIRIYPTPTNGDAVRRMFALKRQIVVVAALFVVLIAVLAFHLANGATPPRTFT